MTHEHRTSSKDIELAGTPKSQDRVVLEDEVALVLKKVRETKQANLTKLLVEPRRSYLPSAGISESSSIRPERRRCRGVSEH
ncbi:hypothetical protein ACWC1D_12360 [Streptomyces sp. NPDC001478]